MEIQETIPGAIRITPEYLAIEVLRTKLPLLLRGVFKHEMVANLSEEERTLFLEEVEIAYNKGFVGGLREFICAKKAREFLLWLAHQSIDCIPDCGYCVYLDAIYNSLQEFFNVPQSVKICVVKTT